MESLIKDIINIDHEAQKKVLEAKAKRQHAFSLQTTKRQEIYDQFMQQSQVEIEARQKSLMEALAKEKVINDEKYKTSLEALLKLYEDHKQTWVDTIVEACIKR